VDPQSGPVRRHRSGRRRVYITARDASYALVGRLFAVMSPGPDDTIAFTGILEIVSLVVLPSMRDHGVGRQLLKAAEEHVRRSGIDTVKISVMVGNDGALGFYTTAGDEPAEITLYRSLPTSSGLRRRGRCR
jgi:ribosomal protein S18 acetylase RimI-like enzyme